MALVLNSWVLVSDTKMHSELLHTIGPVLTLPGMFTVNS